MPHLTKETQTLLMGRVCVLLMIRYDCLFNAPRTASLTPVKAAMSFFNHSPGSVQYQH